VGLGPAVLAPELLLVDAPPPLEELLVLLEPPDAPEPLPTPELELPLLPLPAPEPPFPVPPFDPPPPPSSEPEPELVFVPDELSFPVGSPMLDVVPEAAHAEAHATPRIAKSPKREPHKMLARTMTCLV
jgi:hypothetical protein